VARPDKISGMENAVELETPRAPGQYARERHERGLRNYRRRLYRSLAIGLLLIAAVQFVLAAWVGTTFAWAGFALVLGAAVGVIAVLRELPPDHVRHWGAGAWGEQQTAHALDELVAEGWKLAHDVELARGNIDHIAVSPRGRAFVLETKALQGRIGVENGVLTTTQIDDPEQIYEHRRLRHVVLDRARHVYRERNGDGGWVRAAVVIWGDFEQRRLENGKLVFVHGDELLDWLRQTG
jgi:hypothetical protein